MAQDDFDFKYTYVRWYNDAEGAKIACVSGSYESLPYGSVNDLEFHAEGKPPHPEHGQFQWGLACSKASRVIIADIDQPEAWSCGNTFVEAGNLEDVVSSVRQDGERAHIVIVVPQELLHLWPRQGPAVWGDVKSNGFSYWEGVHSSGLKYVATSPAPLVATEAILTALTADRVFPQGKAGREGAAAMAGPWEDDEYRIQSHDECVATVMSMVQAGLTEQEVTARLGVIMPNREGAWPGRDAYVAEKIRSAERKVDQWEAQEKAEWEGSFGLTYDELAGKVLEAAADRRRTRSPGEIAQQAQQVLAATLPAAPSVASGAGHALISQEQYSKIPLARQLNPMGHPVEPRGAADKTVARDILAQTFWTAQFAEDEGGWLRNEGDHWAVWGTKSEATARARVLVSAYGEYLKTEAQLADELAAKGTADHPGDIDADDRRRERLAKVHVKLNSNAGQSSVGSALVTEALADRRYSVRVSELDAEAHVLWAGGRPWSLLSPELTETPANPVHQKTAACYPDPLAPTPLFDALLEAVWPDPEVRTWALREIAGVALWGETSKLHPVLDGRANGGKSTLALILTRVLGRYAVKVDPQKILGNDMTSAAEEELAALIGARVAWMDEPPPPGKQSISKFNDLASGTGEISAARKYQNRVTAPKRFNFLICQNPRNALQMDSQGVGERMIYIPCDGEPAATMAAWLAWQEHGSAEYPGILARLIRECALYRTGRRLPVPLQAQLGRAAAQERSDELQAWLEENFTIEPGIEDREKQYTAHGVWKFYQAHTRDARLPGLSRAEFKDRLKNLGVTIRDESYGGKRGLVSLRAKPLAMAQLSGMH